LYQLQSSSESGVEIKITFLTGIAEFATYRISVGLGLFFTHRSHQSEQRDADVDTHSLRENNDYSYALRRIPDMSAVTLARALSTFNVFVGAAIIRRARTARGGTTWQ
jgi:hypothetical protein